MRLIEISHPGVANAFVPEAAVPVHVKRGWSVVDAAGVVPQQGPAPEAVPLQPPAKSAPVDDWRTFAVHHGMSEEDAAAATKGYLIDAYGES